MLRRSFCALLNLLPLGAASRLLPESLAGATLPGAASKVQRHRGWRVQWDDMPISKTSLGAWMGVPVSKKALASKNQSALRTLVPRGDGSHPERRKLVGLKRLDHLIASDWKPTNTPQRPWSDSPFQKPAVQGEGFDLEAMRARRAEEAEYWRNAHKDDPNARNLAYARYHGALGSGAISEKAAKEFAEGRRREKEV